MLEGEEEWRRQWAGGEANLVSDESGRDERRTDTGRRWHLELHLSALAAGEGDDGLEKRTSSAMSQSIYTELSNMKPHLVQSHS